MAIRTVRHKVSKQCWSNRSCKRAFIKQYEALGEIYRRTETIASNPNALWVVFRLP